MFFFVIITSINNMCFCVFIFISCTMIDFNLIFIIYIRCIRPIFCAYVWMLSHFVCVEKFDTDATCNYKDQYFKVQFHRMLW